ncbi:hypothetical protein [Granulicella paludicola]|uniref:hypothetical protein n=1 Tax=Granulicella paludicola TaxID=474951 RepID=UPI0021E0284E|nr:hypothetical protein [Granulicella paludicola]
MFRSTHIALALLASATLAFPIAAQNFTVDFTNCSEFVGEGPVSLAVAQPLVPKPFVIAPGPTAAIANIVIRATGCAGASVNHGPSTPTNLSQIGINIVPPDGTGEINNYTLIYVSNNPDLVLHFIAAGLPAQYDPQLTYQYPAGPTGSGNVYVAVAPPPALFGAGTAPYFIYGPETAPPPSSAQDFLANWWYAPQTIFGVARMRQQSNFPAISFGGQSATFYTDSNSTLGKLIGGNADSNFSTLPLRGVYPTAHMEVTVTH